MVWILILIKSISLSQRPQPQITVPLWISSTSTPNPYSYQFPAQHYSSNYSRFNILCIIGKKPGMTPRSTGGTWRTLSQSSICYHQTYITKPLWIISTSTLNPYIYQFPAQHYSPNYSRFKICIIGKKPSMTPRSTRGTWRTLSKTSTCYHQTHIWIPIQ